MASETLAAPKARKSALAARPFVTVRDTGPGLPQDIVDNLFMPFVTTKTRGLGIGLTIVRSIVDSHGGTVAAGNHPEGGATFTVTLRRSTAMNGSDAVTVGGRLSAQQ